MAHSENESWMSTLLPPTLWSASIFQPGLSSLRWWMELTNAADFLRLNSKPHFSSEDNNLRLHPPPGSSCATGGERAKIAEMWRILNKFKIRLPLPQTSQDIITWGQHKNLLICSLYDTVKSSCNKTTRSVPGNPVNVQHTLLVPFPSSGSLAPNPYAVATENCWLMPMVLSQLHRSRNIML